MHILVTGGAGFIGSHIVDAYLQAGHKVTVLDACINPNPNLPPKNVELIREDITRLDLNTLMNDLKFDVVNHHAAQINVRTSINDPIYDAHTNIMGTLRLLQAIVDCDYPLKKFIFASTGGAIYGDRVDYPTKENAQQNPCSPYGIAKLSCERYISFYQKTFNLKCTVLRYSNVYGPRQDPLGEAGVVAIFCEALIKNESPTIYGDGAQTRDFVFVKDVANANLLSTEHEDVTGIFNVSSAGETSVNKLHYKIKAITKSSTDAKHSAAIPGELMRSVIDNRLIREKLGWKPMTNLETGLAATVDFIRAHI